jgi:cytochrome b561
MTPKPRFSKTAKWAHWISALGLWGMFFFGRKVAHMDVSMNNFHLFGWHKSIGISLLVLILLRIIIRARHKPTGHPDPHSMQHKAARTMHLVLYILMVLTPIFGLLGSFASGLPTVYFGMFEIPTLLSENEVWEVWLFKLHGLCALTLILLSVLHICAGLYHHLIRKNDTLIAMLPVFRS